MTQLFSVAFPYLYQSVLPVFISVSPTMEILGEETNTTSPRSHAWLLIFAVALVSVHLFYLLTVVLYSGVQFFLVWNEIFRTQRPKTLQTELVTQIYHHTLSVEVPTCPICLIDYSTSWNKNVDTCVTAIVWLQRTHSLELFALFFWMILFLPILFLLLFFFIIIVMHTFINRWWRCH